MEPELTCATTQICAASKAGDFEHQETFVWTTEAPEHLPVLGLTEVNEPKLEKITV